MPCHTQGSEKNSNNPNIQRHTQNLFEPTLLPLCAYLYSVIFNEADIKGQYGVCITLCGLCVEISGRHRCVGREEGTTGFNR